MPICVQDCSGSMVSHFPDDEGHTVTRLEFVARQLKHVVTEVRIHGRREGSGRGDERWEERWRLGGVKGEVVMMGWSKGKC